jgi:hypothetical protein
MTDFALSCAVHPDRETTLRCNRCEKPICTECAVLTPVGYRCQECVREQQSSFETAQSIDFLVAAVIPAFGVAIAIALLNFLGFWGLLLAPIAGGGLAELLLRAMRGRRSQHLSLIAAIGGAVGTLPHVLPTLATLLLTGFDPVILGAFGFSLLWPVLYGGLTIGSMVARLRGIRL